MASFSERTGVYKVMLRHSLLKDETSSSFTSFSTEPSLNSALVELGYAEAVPGSALDVEIQLEKTIDDPEQMSQFGEFHKFFPWENSCGLFLIEFVKLAVGSFLNLLLLGRDFLFFSF